MEERYNLTLNVLRFTLLIVALGLAIGCSGKDDALRQSEDVDPFGDASGGD